MLGNLYPLYLVNTQAKQGVLTYLFSVLSTFKYDELIPNDKTQEHLHNLRQKACTTLIKIFERDPTLFGVWKFKFF